MYAYERISLCTVADIVAKGLVQWPSNIHDWRLVQWLTSRKPAFKKFNTSHGYGTSVTVQDFSHCTRLRTLYPWLVTGYFFHIFRHVQVAGNLTYSTNHDLDKPSQCVWCLHLHRREPTWKTWKGIYGVSVPYSYRNCTVHWKRTVFWYL